MKRDSLLGCDEPVARSAAHRAPGRARTRRRRRCLAPVEGTLLGWAHPACRRSRVLELVGRPRYRYRPPRGISRPVRRRRRLLSLPGGRCGRGRTASRGTPGIRRTAAGLSLEGHRTSVRPPLLRWAVCARTGCPSGGRLAPKRRAHGTVGVPGRLRPDRRETQGDETQPDLREGDGEGPPRSQPEEGGGDGHGDDGDCEHEPEGPHASSGGRGPSTGRPKGGTPDLAQRRTGGSRLAPSALARMWRRRRTTSDER